MGGMGLSYPPPPLERFKINFWGCGVEEYILCALWSSTSYWWRCTIDSFSSCERMLAFRLHRSKKLGVPFKSLKRLPQPPRLSTNTEGVFRKPHGFSCRRAYGLLLLRIVSFLSPRRAAVVGNQRCCLLSLELLCDLVTATTTKYDIYIHIFTNA